MSKMRKKAQDAQYCYEDLLVRTGLKLETKVIFNVAENQQELIKRGCYKYNPFPGIVKLVLLKLRLKAVNRLFEDEKVIQTAPAAAILSLNAVLSSEIERLRTGKNNENPVICDVGFAGLQVIRLYMMGYEGNAIFSKSRYESAIRVDNALNGSFYKYRTADGRYFSAHVYYESQKQKMMHLLGMKKDPNQFKLGTLPFDKMTTKKAIKRFDAIDLEEKSFEVGACGCMLRSREEWENTEVGKAVNDMPLYRLVKVAEAPVKSFGTNTSRGSLTGVKVLDLTHIIAGPACTRILAEQGANVLLVRRGKFTEQEQAMLELDGWAGKHAIHLDFNEAEGLNRVKELIKQADVVICSYQQGALDKFGLSGEAIHELNPSVIYGAMMCFSDTVWRTRPGWAPLAEDITGLSIRNGSQEKPVNLNGVPLDYIPGFLMAAGVLQALKLSMTEGGAYDVTVSLTRAGYWLHECTDLCEKATDKTTSAVCEVAERMEISQWQELWYTAKHTAVGNVRFPMPATYQKEAVQPLENIIFTDGEISWTDAVNSGTTDAVMNWDNKAAGQD